MGVQPFVICPVVTSSEWTEKLGIPSAAHNLFERIIRNPRPESDNPRERECTEMIAAVLLNTRSLRDCIFSWMGRRIGSTSKVWESATACVRIETEQSMEGKRDDLRILIEAEGEEPLVWSIEVKVGAFFHHSSSIESVPQEYVEDENQLLRKSVNQVSNYDVFLHKEYPKAKKGGFVLAKTNLEQYLPDGLACKWQCITWGELAKVTADFLGGTDLPDKDVFLARHILGFINKHLSEDNIMNNTNLELDDISLIKAFGVLGTDCERKVDTLVAPLVQIISNAISGVGDPKHQASLFKGNGRSVVWAPLVKNTHFPQLFAGVVMGNSDAPSPQVSVWIETSPQSKVKPDVKRLAKESLAELKKKKERNWTLGKDGDWWDIETSADMKHLLAADDQGKWIQDYVQGAIDDLKAVGLIDRLCALAK